LAAQSCDALLQVKAVDVKLKAASASELKTFILELFAIVRTGGSSTEEFKKHLYPLCPAEMKLSVASVKEALKSKAEGEMVVLCRDLFSARAAVFNDAFAGERALGRAAAAACTRRRCACLIPTLARLRAKG